MNTLILQAPTPGSLAIGYVAVGIVLAIAGLFLWTIIGIYIDDYQDAQKRKREETNEERE